MKINKSKIILSLKVTLALSYACCIYIASSRDTSSVPMPPYTDKLIHFTEFGILSLLICWIMVSLQIETKWKWYLFAIGITSFYGASDEFHQSFTPNRSMDILDWFADTLGAITTAIFWRIITNKRQISTIKDAKS